MKHRDFVIGVLTGAVLFGSFTVIADNYDIYPNPFKILVNGNERYIEGYNIDGYSYFKLRDIGNEMGFSVDFKEDTIMIDNIDSGQTIISSTTRDTVKPWYEYINIDGNDYIRCFGLSGLIQDNISMDWGILHSKNISDCSKNEHGYYCLLVNQEFLAKSPVAEYEIPCVYIDGECYLTREVFENEVLARVLSDK